MADPWNDLLMAYLHDPPDKALEIPGHMKRASLHASAVLGERVVPKDLHQHMDQLASAVERLPMPTAGKNGERAVGPAGGKLRIVHPLSSLWEDLTVGSDAQQIQAPITEVIERLLDDCDTPGKRFLTLWRLLPERLAALHPWLARLPADTRIPDHTIWHHLDVTAGLKPGELEAGGTAFLTFSLGPVQTFISTARSVRDLWSGSMILSWLTFQAMMPIIEQLGPTALVYPALRGVPILDRWLQEKQGLRFGSNTLEQPTTASLRMAPCLPNRFVAVIPFGVDGHAAKQLATDCEQAARKAWFCMAGEVNKALDHQLRGLCPDWAKRWDMQIKDFFDMRTVILPWNQANDDVLAKLLCDRRSFADAFTDGAEAIRRMAEAIPEGQCPKYGQRSAGQWQHRLDLTARLLEAQKTVRQVPPHTREDEHYPPKCSLMGSYEQMGPDDLAASGVFWKAAPKTALAGVRIRLGERLCAVALVKRFCGPAYLADKLGISTDDLRFPDTATVAAAAWLMEASIDPQEIRASDKDRKWNGQWLHWPRPDFEEDYPCPQDVGKRIEEAKKQYGKPPTYYAILMMDGDDLGGWLRGDNSPTVREVMHPDLVRYYESLGAKAKPGLDAKRPVGPALHAAISTALANFALHVVPQVVKKHHGTLIYSGGDDTLVLLPTSQALACALALREQYQQEYDAEGRLLMGSRATLTAGLAVVHCKEDLRFALDAARTAEKAAKAAGKNALQIAVCRRSGEHSSALCPWSFVESIRNWVQYFVAGASDRWAYHLAGELHTLEGLPEEAMQAEIRRQIKRAEERTRTAFEETPDQFRKYCHTCVTEQQRFDGAGMALRHFIALCQSASFLARGRDQ